jgi:S-disulfanyl-L-cysteine oxidoreductase SoxD
MISMIRARLGPLFILSALASLGVAPAIGQTPNATETATGTTVRDGVYSAEQARRGRTAYDAKCASCHDGGTMGPELAGDAFLAQWQSKTVRSFYNRIVETMPADDAGSLTEAEALDVIAYVLQMNRFPPGERALQTASALDAMKFVAPK